MKRTFHDAFGYGRETAQLFVYSFSRANVLFVLNLTQEHDDVQFSSAHRCEILPGGREALPVVQKIKLSKY